MGLVWVQHNGKVITAPFTRNHWKPPPTQKSLILLTPPMLVSEMLRALVGKQSACSGALRVYEVTPNLYETGFSSTQLIYQHKCPIKPQLWLHFQKFRVSFASCSNTFEMFRNCDQRIVRVFGMDSKESKFLKPVPTVFASWIFNDLWTDFNGWHSYLCFVCKKIYRHV